MATTCTKAEYFFGTIQRIYDVFSNSTKRWQILKDSVKGLTVKPLSTTRWESRVKSVKPIRFQLSAVREALLEVRDTEGDPKTTSDANSLRNKFSDFEFIVSISIWYEVLSNVNVVSQKLQSKDMIIDDAIDQELGEKDLKPCCYSLQDALKNGEESDIDAEELYGELKLWILTPNALVAYRVLLTIPVTVASAERSFSLLKLLKAYLRSSMSQERLNGLAIIAIENDVLETMDYKELIECFGYKNAKRA
ncbi:uncharacterized protein LOC143566433 [Bidens hawaiensis]|uniref:uncharacterized protein LOC143566433 n=1 Tax=Bidens hawaiensis TaxID=980011 RepID=UPI00404B6E13